jgi:hypothetical protein
MEALREELEELEEQLTDSIIDSIKGKQVSPRCPRWHLLLLTCIGGLGSLLLLSRTQCQASTNGCTTFVPWM